MEPKSQEEEGTKQEETKQEETKQEETKQEETKQEEIKQEDTKQEDTKQEETKQEETKQEETKHEETKQEEVVKTHDVIVKGLAYAATEENIEDFFSAYGKLDSINLLTRDDGKSKGICFLRYLSEEDANKAIEASGVDLMGRSVFMEKARPRGQRSDNSHRRGGRNNYSGGGDRNNYGGGGGRNNYGGGGGRNNYGGGGGGGRQQNGPTKTLYVGNLNYDTNEDDLYYEFETFGEISEVRLVTNYNGSSKGFAFVEFAELSCAEDALEIDGKNISGRNIRVNFAEEGRKRRRRNYD